MKQAGISFGVFAALLGLLPRILGSSLAEDFSTNPFAPGSGRWQVIGDTGLFRWDAGAGVLAVTWDSAKSNSFCLLPLGMTLTSTNTFGFACDLTLTEAGPRIGAARPQVLQVSLALVRQSLLPGGYPLRTAGGRAADLLDFNFFPLADYGPLGMAAYIAPAAFGRRQAGYSFGNSHDLADGQPHRIECHWDPVNRRLTTAVSNAGPIQPTDPSLPADDDFAVDALAVVVWSEAPTPQDSLLARGTLDNVVVHRPAFGSVTAARLTFDATTRTVRFPSQPGVIYQLEASDTLVSWSALGPAQVGTGQEIAMSDGRKALFPQQFYRVSAREHP